MVRPLIFLALLSAPLSAATPPKVQPQRHPSTQLDWVHIVAPTTEGGMRMGNPSASLKIVEYGSRTCPHCATFDAEGLADLKANYIATGKVSYEFRDFPVHGALDLAPILLGHCVRPSQFFPVLSQMYRIQSELLSNADATIAAVQSRRDATPNQIASSFAEGLGYLRFMKQRGFSEPQLRGCLNDQKKVVTIANQAKFAAQTYKVDGTPTFILNGKPLADVYGWAALEKFLSSGRS